MTEATTILVSSLYGEVKCPVVLGQTTIGEIKQRVAAAIRNNPLFKEEYPDAPPGLPNRAFTLLNYYRFGRGLGEIREGDDSRIIEEAKQVDKQVPYFAITYNHDKAMAQVMVKSARNVR